MADPIITKIGDVSAYLDAVAHGFEGTRAEFGELLANSANYAQSAESAASAAIASAATATTKAGEATTAATAAQTAKTQTEAAASQALTDIGTAESGAISAIQTEGATQTANATAQAQAAATSATTASTKASEASASATTATTKATEAAASATSAANAASAAQGVLESIPEDYSDLSEDVDQLKADLGDLDAVIYPNSDVVVTAIDDFALNNTNISAELPILQNGHRYRIFVQFSGTPTSLITIRTATGTSGSTVVDDITATFEGDSWTEGKECIYQPGVINIRYLRFSFNSSYANDLTCDITLYDYDKEMETGFEQLDVRIAENAERIDGMEYIVDLDRDYNLLPPDGYTVGKIITSEGVIANDATNVLSDYIPIDPAQGYICNWAKTASIIPGNSGMTGSVDCFIRYCFCFFDADKNVIPFTGDVKAASKAIPENAAYIRVCTKSEEAYKIARLIYGNYQSQPVIRLVEHVKTKQDRLDSPNTGFEGFKMVMFGDSITHGSLTTGDDGVSYVDYANDVLRSNILNVGFGGTRMTYSLSGAGLFCFYNLCNCITSDSDDRWDALDAYLLENATYAPHLARLKQIDWSTVSAVGLLYGANDFTSNTPVGTDYNEDTSKYDGACAYGLKKLLTKYPHLQVIIFAPFDRETTQSSASTMTDVQANSQGLYMRDYAESLKNVQKRFHCPVIMTGENFGVNVYNIMKYTLDGTHPRANIAQKRLGWLVAQAIRNNLAPY